MLKKRKKIIVAVLVLTLVSSGVIWFINKYLIENRFKEYLPDYVMEQGEVFEELPDKDGIGGFVLAAENEHYKLYTNTETTEIALRKKSTGETVYSNPQDRNSDSIATTANLNELNSTLVVKYYNSSRTSASMTNYEMSIQAGQFELQKLKDGIRYVYTLSNAGSDTGIVPLQIAEDSMKIKILEKLSKKESMTFTGAYKQKDGIYYLTDSAKIAPITISKLTKLLEKAGYTEKDFKEDNLSTEEENPGFVIGLEYRLTVDGLRVSVPAEMIRETGGAKIYRIQLLKYMGAEKTSDNCYMLVPNGSGSLINFKNGSNSQAGYSQYVYGTDPVMQNYIVVENTEDARLPVYGIKGQRACLFSVITEGSALSSINADTAGKSTEYNNAFASFSLREMELLNMFGISGMQSDTPSIEKDFYHINFSVDYTILSNEEADYSGMANYYRNYLIRKGVLKEKYSADEIPLYLEIIGGVEKKEHLAGIPYGDVYPMTTYKQAEDMVNYLNDKGVVNIRVTYRGWFNGGIYHDVADEIHLMKVLGTKKELENLSSLLEKQGGKLYLESAFNKVPSTSSRYQMKLQSSKYYSGYVVSLGAVNPSSLRQTGNLGWYDELTYSILSPRFLPFYIRGFAEKIEKYKVSGIALRDLGTILASDKTKSNLINREDALAITKGMFAKLGDTGKELLVKGGNEYALAYAGDITNISTNDNEFDIIDKEVPFIEMVLHGYKPYAGSSLNLTGNYEYEETLLKYLEYGVYPNFTVSYQNSEEIKYTSSANLSSTQFMIWQNSILKLYKELNGVLSRVGSAEMVSHRVMKNGLVKVNYSNGITIYINHTNNILTDGVQSVNPKNYKVIGGNE